MGKQLGLCFGDHDSEALNHIMKLKAGEDKSSHKPGVFSGEEQRSGRSPRTIKSGAILLGVLSTSFSMIVVSWNVRGLGKPEKRRAKIG